jgi:hypothetical protein
MSWWDEWKAVQGSLAPEWAKAADAAVERYGRAASARPEQFRGAIVSALASLERSRTKLAALEQLVRSSKATDDLDRQNLAALTAQFRGLAAPIYSGMRPATKDEVGIAPVILVVGGLAVVAIVVLCCAHVYQQYLAELEHELDLQAMELEARDRASREGRTLQPSTLPPPPSSGGTGLSTLALVGLAGAGVGLLLWSRS